jgi:hypothetical protein
MHGLATIFTNYDAAGKSFRAHLEGFMCERLFKTAEFFDNWHKDSQFGVNFF